MSVGLGPSVVQLGGAGAVASTDITDATATGEALLTAASAAAARTTLGLGSLATASTVASTSISDSTATGRSVLTAASAAAARSAISAAASPTGIPALPTTGLVLDLDASGLSLGALASWASSVGTFAAVQATGSKQPIVTDCAVGLSRGVVFDGTDDYLAIAHEAALDWSTLAIYVVCQMHRNASNTSPSDQNIIGRVHGDSAGTSPYFRYNIRAVSETGIAHYTSGTNSGTLGVPEGGSLLSPHLLHFKVGSDGAYSKIDGKSVWGNATPTSLTYPDARAVAIGAADYSTPGQFFQGAIARVLIYAGVTQTAATRRDVERFLASAYNIPSLGFTSYG